MQRPSLTFIHVINIQSLMSRVPLTDTLTYQGLLTHKLA